MTTTTMPESPPPEAGSSMQRFAIAINFFFPSLAIVVLALRLYSKTMGKSLEPGTFRHPSTLLGPDDAFACASMAASIALTISSYFYITTNNVGHEFPSPPSDMKQALIWTYVITIFYYPVLGLIKSSILVFLLRLSDQKRSLRYIIHGFNVFNLCGTVAVFLTAVVQCRPIRYFWDSSVEGTCINQGVFYLSQSGLNILTDVMTFAVPVSIFMRLRMARRTRIATLYVFFLGLIVTIIGVVRFIFMYMLFYTDIRTMKHFTMSFCLSAIETNLAIVCACAPTLRGLARSTFPRFFLTRSSNPHHAEHHDFADPAEDPYLDAKSPAAAGVRHRERCSFTAEGTFGYPKDGRNRAISSRAEVEGFRLSPSEEEIMNYNGIMMTTDVVVEHDGSSRAARTSRTDSTSTSSSRTSAGPRGRRPDSMSLATDDLEGPRGRRRSSVSSTGSRGRPRSRAGEGSVRSIPRSLGSAELRRGQEEDSEGVGWRPDGGGTRG